MNIRITLLYDLNSGVPDPTDRIQEILRQSYDYQHNGLDHETITSSGTVQHNFYIYPDHCDQSKRTLETLRQLEDLIMSYI